MLAGEFRIECRQGSCGESFIAARAVRAPMHLSKPFWDGNYLVVNAVNSTAGILSGDTIAMQARVENGARVVITSPSANRVFRARDKAGTVTQHLHVEPGGILVWWPELFIPHAGCRYRQETHIEVTHGGALVFAETLAPGRTASGELFEYAGLNWQTSLSFEGKCVALERYNLSPGHPAITAARRLYPAAYLGSVFIVPAEETTVASLVDSLRTVEHEGALAGTSALVRGGCVVRVIARSSLALRTAMDALFHRIFSALALPVPMLRKL